MRLWPMAISNIMTRSMTSRISDSAAEKEFEAQVTEDNTQTAQFYRVSRIYRDVRLACPALNLTHEVSLQSTEPTYFFFS